MCRGGSKKTFHVDRIRLAKTNNWGISNTSWELNIKRVNDLDVNLYDF